VLERLGEVAQGAGTLWLGEAVESGGRVGGQVGQVGEIGLAGVPEMVHVAGGDEAVGVEQPQGQQAGRSAGRPGSWRATIKS
jgi:hypothetical protein